MNLLCSKRKTLKFFQVTKKNNDKLLSGGRAPLDIAKYLKHDHRTIRNLCGNITEKRTWAKKKLWQKKISALQLGHLEQAISEHRLQNSSTLFAEANIECPSRSTRCHILWELARVKKAKTTPPISEKHKQNRLDFAEKYVKLDFLEAIFTEVCRATLDGPHGLAISTYPPRQFKSASKQEVLCFQQVWQITNLWGRSEFWKVSNRIRKATLVFWLTTLSIGTIGLTLRLLISFCSCKIMPAVTSLSINSIENLWSIVKNEVYNGGKQFFNNEKLWAKISEVCGCISPSTIHKLTKSVVKRLIELLKNSGDYTLR